MTTNSPGLTGPKEKAPGPSKTERQIEVPSASVSMADIIGGVAMLVVALTWNVVMWRWR